MKLESFNSVVWSSVPAFSCPASELVPILERIGAADSWSRADAIAEDWTILAQELVQGCDISPAAQLVVPWLVEFAKKRTSTDLVHVWLLLGELEIGRLTGDRDSIPSDVFEVIAPIARSAASESTLEGQKALATAMFLVHQLPDWGRLFILRLVVDGQRYAPCMACGELLDVERNSSWTVGGAPIQPKPCNLAYETVINLIRECGALYCVTSLGAVDELVGEVQCVACNQSIDVIKLLSQPLTSSPKSEET